MNSSLTQLQPQTGSQAKLRGSVVKLTSSPTGQRSPRRVNSHSYVAKFNTELQSIQNTEYRSKNPHLFTWKHTLHHQNKLKFLPSPKQRMSQINTLIKDETADAKTEDTFLNNSPTTLPFDSIKDIDYNFEPLEELKPIKRITEEKYINPAFTQEYFEDLKKSFLREQKKKEITLSQRENKSFSVVKLQTNILTRQSSPLAKNIANIQYMSNQFDRKNFNYNKIINQITAQDDMLDKQELEEEAIRKLKYVSKDVKLKRILKPKTASNSISRPVTFSPSKNLDKNALTTFYSPDNRASIHKSLPKNALDLNSSKNQKSRSLKFGRDTPEGDTIVQKKEDGTVLSLKEEPPFSFMNKANYKKIVKKVKKLNESCKLDPKEYSQIVQSGLNHLIQPNNLKSDRLFRNSTSTKFFVRLRSRDQNFSTINSPNNLTKDNLTLNRTLHHSKSPDKYDDNIFHYGKYFKQKYMERGLYLEVSKDLKQRIQDFSRELKESAQKVRTVDLKKHAN